MGITQPRIPTMDVITADPTTGLVVEAFIPTAGTLPTGTTFAGIFSVAAELQVLGGAVAGVYANTGTTASPAWTAQ